MFDVAEILLTMWQAFFTQQNSPVNEETVIKPKLSHNKSYVHLLHA